MAKIFFKILFTIIPFVCAAQKQGNKWYFGDQVGLDFASGIPSVLAGATYTVTGCIAEGTSVISDSSGSLLFYTNGQEVWNRNHTVMPNGDSLLGNLSSTQSSIIIPQPGSSRYFYTFTVSDFACDILKYGLRYSVVDICLDSGLGDIIPNQKNIKLLDTVAEKLTAVRHANGIDYWIITHKYFSDAFYSYHLSSIGIIDTAISHVGSIHPVNMIGNGGAIGQLKASPDGQKLAIVNGQSAPNVAEYFDFDKTTGIVSNCRNIQTNPNYSYYGVSFSPDNSKLYISCWLNNNGVYQYDLNAGGGNADSVKASRTQIDNGTHYGLQLANNGKIYLCRGGNLYFLSVINNPNNLGTNCNYQDSAIYLGGKTNYEGLPNFIDSYDYSNTIYDCQTGVNEFTNTNNIILSEPRPNPNNGKAEIDYYLPVSASYAKIIFTDMLGRVINEAKLVTGYGTISVDTQDLPSGIYNYSMMINEKTLDTKKMVRSK